MSERAKKAEPLKAAFLRRAEVAHELGIARNTRTKITKTDTRFPRFFELTPGIRVIERRDLEKWIRLKRLMAEREDVPT